MRADVTEVNRAERPLYQCLRTLSVLPRRVRTALIVIFDVMVSVIAAHAAFWLRLGEWHFLSPPVLAFVAIAIPTWFLVAIPMGIYRSLLRFSGRQTVALIITSCGVMSIILGVVLLWLQLEGVPRTLALLHPLLFSLAIGAGRLGIASLLLSSLLSRQLRKKRRRILIFGAGVAGQQLAVSIRQDPEIQVVGFVDEDELLRKRRLEGRPIWHSSDLERILKLMNVDEVFLALSSSRSARRKIVERVHRSASGVRVRALPSLSDLVCGNVTVNDLREIQIEELLGRDEVSPDSALMAKNITGKSVLITGAGGSIGSELCRQILLQLPLRMILLEQSELALYNINSELQELQSRRGLRVDIVPALVDAAEKSECERIFRSYGPDTVFHAAAYKHVPLVEANPLAGIRNNVIGTLNACLAAESANARNFILVSTDKAVRPSSVMGASKRMCELILQARAAMQTSTTYSAVRFGNVLGSSGSVVPLFKWQIQQGGPVTITHRDATRYFMTISEAAQLVIQAGAMAKGGEIFLLDMGEPVRIYDLARLMIELSGLTVLDVCNPEGDIEIVEVGLRPGEKLFEELLIESSAGPTSHPRIVEAREPKIRWQALEIILRQVADAIQNADAPAALALLKLLVGNNVAEEHSGSPAVTSPLHLTESSHRLSS